MKLKKIFAAAAAATLAFSAVSALTASAAVTNANNGANYQVDLPDVADLPWQGGVSGCIVTMTLADGWADTGAGGAIVFQGDGLSWGDGTKEFKMDGTGVAASDDATASTVSGNTLTCTYDFGGTIFATGATWGQCIIASYWGADITVDDIKYLDLNGDIIGAPQGGTTTTTTTTTTTAAAGGTTTAAAGGTTTAAAGGTTAAGTTTAAEDSAQTGVSNGMVGLAGIACLLVIAGGTAVFCKKH